MLILMQYSLLVLVFLRLDNLLGNLVGKVWLCRIQQFVNVVLVLTLIGIDLFVSEKCSPCCPLLFQRPFSLNL